MNKAEAIVEYTTKRLVITLENRTIDQILEDGKWVMDSVTWHFDIAYHDFPRHLYIPPETLRRMYEENTGNWADVDLTYWNVQTDKIRSVRRLIEQVRQIYANYLATYWFWCDTHQRFDESGDLCSQCIIEDEKREAGQ